MNSNMNSRKMCILGRKYMKIDFQEPINNSPPNILMYFHILFDPVA